VKEEVLIITVVETHAVVMVVETAVVETTVVETEEDINIFSSYKKVSIDTFFCFIGLNKPSHTSLVL
jgi:hypothetical protein